MSEYTQLTLLPANPLECACDWCRNGVWHANGDGYFCCTAPGMGHVTAKNRKARTECRFYEKRSE